MKVGFVGAGKLGLPVALAMENKGHEVSVYDVNPEVTNYLTELHGYPFQEEGIKPLIEANHINVVGSIGEIVADSDIIFVPIQTPHDPRFEGDKPLPKERADFNYDYLKAGIADIAKECGEQAVKRTVVVISTCLPGTYEREIKPLLNENISYVYNPYFIAMGTVIKDFLDPEFVLIGHDNNGEEARQLAEFYKTLHDKPHLITDVTTAEAIKVSYNTYITAKTVLANAWGELAHKIGANADDIYRAWSMADDRLISSKYLQAGVADGGGCHPRDNIALSHIAQQLGLSHNIWEDLMQAREDHMDWLAREAIGLSKQSGLPLIILGKSFKPGTNIETGSAAVLLKNLIDKYGHPVDHFTGLIRLEAAVYVIGVKEAGYQEYEFEPGSVVLDPFRYIPPRQGVKVVAIGGEAGKPSSGSETPQ